MFWLVNVLLFIGTFLVPIQSQAKIIETHRLADILTEVDRDTIIFFDIDDTLINSPYMLGNSSWWRYFVATLLNANINKGTPEIYQLVKKIINKIPMVLIESDTAEHIKNLQMQDILTFGLTARKINNEYSQPHGLGTHEHLKSVGINFTFTPLPKPLDDTTKRFFSYGIIFTDHQKKGPFLQNFLNNMSLRPAKIVFIDDQLDQLYSVKNSVESMGIQFVGYRYGKLDNLHANFNPLIANIQLEALIKNDQLISDEEALSIAQKNPGLDNDYFMNELIKTLEKG